MRRAFVVSIIVVLSGALLALAGCGDEPVVVSREALGTVVTITAYGEDEAAVTAAIDGAYAAMTAVEGQLDAYNNASAIAQFNLTPYTPAAIPADANVILDEIGGLGVSADFSPTLLGVLRLYDFEGAPKVPGDADLALAVAAANTFRRNGDGTVEFMRGDNPDTRLDAGGLLAPGLDFGGAAKGLALDRAREALKASGAVTAAIISSGSSTVTLGTKPDGGDWVIGIEDPRDPERIVATFTFEADGALSTSGDYRDYREVSGRRVSHTIDPRSGSPVAHRLASVTVVHASVAAADAWATALMVLGPEQGTLLARRLGLAALFIERDASGALRETATPGFASLRRPLPRGL